LARNEDRLDVLSALVGLGVKTGAFGRNSGQKQVDVSLIMKNIV